MLYNLEWLEVGKKFPPTEELGRLEKYQINGKLFASDDLDVSKLTDRITRIIGNFRDMVDFPVIFNYQRMVSLKTADLVAGEYPTITATDKKDITEVREDSDFDSQLYTTVIDLSRYGDAVWRVYKDEVTGKGNFTVWNPSSWFPIVIPDGTNRIESQVLAWKYNIGTDDLPDWRLYVQVHYIGYYEDREYRLDYSGVEIRELIRDPKVSTGLEVNAVMNLRNIRTSDTVYGYDDYTTINTLVSELVARVGQVSKILDKHADPSMTGPVSMLSIDPSTGRSYLKTGSFYAVSPGEEQPKYMTWDGQLNAAFQEIQLLVDQLYILSELGSALLGGAEKTGQAISGTAMRFKMVNPLAKARRLANAMTRPIKLLLAAMTTLGYTKVEASEITVQWQDGIPSDPRETVETALLASGHKQVLPLVRVLEEYFGMSTDEATKVYELISKEQEKLQEITNKFKEEKPEPFGPKEKGNKTGLSNFKQERD